MRELTYNEAAVEAIAEEMRRDPKVFYMSTDALPPLLKEFGPKRIRATPIAEAALTGMGIGAAGSGFRPIVDWRQVIVRIRDNNPVISFESGRLMARRGEVPEEDYTIPLGVADVKREGSDITVVALAWLVHEALAAAETLAAEGISVEVVDPRTLVPLDAETIRKSVRKTGRLIIADEAGPTAGFSAEVAALATEDAATFARLKAPVKRVCALQVPIPYSPVLENAVFPDRNRIIAGVREVLRGRGAAEAA